MDRPAPRHIGFFTAGPSFDGGTIRERALGGSETALIQAARALAEQGHVVKVFNNCRTAGVHDGVAYVPVREYPARTAGLYFDVFIVSRFFGFFDVPINAGVKVLWNHDTLEKPGELRRLMDRIDIMFVLSRFHRDHYLTRIPSLQDKMFVTRNGIDMGLIDDASRGVRKNPSKVIYASRPERGLKPLLENIWPRLLQARPDLTLHLCGYSVDRTDLAPGLPELYSQIDRLAEAAPNTTVLGPLSKRDYYRHLAESALMLYPCNFPEISCLAALEAQVCRTPIITTDGYALRETVKNKHFLIPGNPGEPDYDDLFVSRVLDYLDHPEKTAEDGLKARNAVAAEHGWADITGQWNRLFGLMISRRSRLNRLSEAGA